MRDFEELMEKVLREEAGAEPLAGLEERVMARVRLAGRAERRAWSRSGWMWWAAALPVGVAVAFLWPRAVAPVQERGGGTAKASGAVAGVDGGQGAAAVESGRRDEGLKIERAGPGEKVVWAGKVRRGEAKAVKAEELPKLEVFPAPSEPTAEMRAMLEIARQRPGKRLVEAEEAGSGLKIEPIRIAGIEIAPLNPADANDRKTTER